MNIFQILFYQPLFNSLVLFYQWVGNFGVAVILLTVAIKALLLPLNSKALKSQKMMAELDPKLKKIQKENKDNQEELVKQTMALYKESGFNPLSGTMVLFIQLPVLIALYQVFIKFTLNQELNSFYSFITKPESINPFFLGVNLSEPLWYAALIASVFLFLQSRIMRPKTESKKSNDFAQTFQKQMLYFLPAFTFIVLLKVPSAISLYLMVSGAISIIESKYVQKLRNKQD